MRFTVDLPDGLVSAIKLRADNENIKLDDLVAELLRHGLFKISNDDRRIRHRTKFPLIRGGHPAKPGTEITPERAAEILLEQEVSNLVTVR